MVEIMALRLFPQIVQPEWRLHHAALQAGDIGIDSPAWMQGDSLRGAEREETP